MKSIFSVGIAFSIKKLFALLLLPVVMISAQLGTVIGFTDGTPIEATKRDYCFDNSGLLIGGYNFDLSHTDAEHVSYVKEAGIDFLITSVNEDFLDLCDQYGVGVIAKNYNAPAYYYKTYDDKKWFDIAAATYKDHACLWGDDLIDEPVASEFATLGEMTNHYYSTTDGKLPLINLFPIYANSEQLGNEPQIPMWKQFVFPYRDFTNSDVDKYKRHVSDYINNIDTDYISVDIYPLSVIDGKLTTNNSWLRNLDILAEACRETGRDLWVITQAAGNCVSEGGNGTRHNDTNDIRWQSYVTLSFGAKAIIHACYDSGWWDRDSHLINAAGERTDTYYAAKTVDEELKVISDIYGEYTNCGAFLHNKSMAAGAVNDAFLMPVSASLKPSVMSTSPLLVGCFEKTDGDGRAYTFVNMTEPELDKSATAKISFDGASKITVYDKGETTVINGNSMRLNLNSSEGVFVTVE